MTYFVYFFPLSTSTIRQSPSEGSKQQDLENTIPWVVLERIFQALPKSHSLQEDIKDGEEKNGGKVSMLNFLEGLGNPVAPKPIPTCFGHF